MNRSPLVSVVNIVGRRLGLEAATEFREKDLLDEARQRAGFTDSGDSFFLEPFSRLIEFLRTQARLNLVGRLATRYDLIRLLVNRLQMEKDKKRNPGIVEEEIREEQIRRLSEAAHIFWDAGCILIITAIELTQNDLEIVKTAVTHERIEVVWVGGEVTTNLAYDLIIPNPKRVEAAVARIKGMLREKGIIFRENNPQDSEESVSTPLPSSSYTQ